jgi:hypothetical protein
MRCRYTKFITLAVIGMVLGSNAAWGVSQTPPSAPVTVVNTPSNPVPVSLQGTGTISGSVAITNEVSVRDADNPAFQPITLTVRFSFDSGVGPDARSDSIYTVPAGKRFVIEHAAARVLATPASNTGRAYFDLQVSDGTSSVPVPIGTTNESGPCTLSQACCVISKPVRVYVDPGSSITVALGFLVSQSSAFTSGNITISGHLVDIQ